MSQAFTRKKEKRPRTSSNEIHTSFVQHVTSRVSGLLPATITNWFSSPSSSHANGSAPTSEVTDSSTEDEGPERPVNQPPAKRMRFNSPNSKYNHYGPLDATCIPSNIEITEVPVSHYSGVQYSNNRNSVAFPTIRSSNELFANEPVKDKSERDTSRYKSTQHTVASIRQSVAAKRKSIFDTTNKCTTTSTSTTSDLRGPYFKPALLGSPFYPGRTTYGGAAFAPIHQPNIQQRKVALVKDTKSNADNAMSTSARRIMTLLESYSSPLTEARRIRHYTAPNKESCNSSANELLTSPIKSYKTQELYVPSIAAIMRIKQKSRLMETTKAARQIIASHSSASSYPLTHPPTTIATSVTTNTDQAIPDGQSRSESETEQNNKMTTKVKTRVTRSNRAQQEKFDMATPVKLPSATLQIDQNKLPKFSFGSPISFAMSHATSTPKVVLSAAKPVDTKESTELSTSKPEIVTSSSTFKFSSPIKISSATPEPVTTPPKFTFDSPQRNIEQSYDKKSDVSSIVGKDKEPDKTTAAKESSVVGEVKETNKTTAVKESSVVGEVKETNKTTAEKNWSCPECWVNNKPQVTKCVCCGHKRTTTAKCSVCKLADSQSQKDKCTNCDKMVSPSSAKPNQLPKWKCDGCWIMNEDSVKKCPCCGGSRPTEASNAATASVAVKNADSLLVETGNSGPGCFTVGSPQIKPDLEQTEPPASSRSFFGSYDQNDSAFVSLAKTQKSNKWECPSCLVMNDSDISKCVCCGAEKEPKTKLPTTKFNFDLNTNTSFKFGIDPKVQETVLVKKPEVQILTEHKLKEPSETNNNVLAETPTFICTLPTKKLESKIETIKENLTEPVKFNFGVPKNITLQTNKMEPSKIIDQNKEKLQEVPQMNFTSPIEEKQKLGGLFASPVTHGSERDKLLLPSSNLFTSPTNEEKKEPPNKPTILQTPVTSSETTQQQNSFTLGGSTIRLATNLFATPSKAPSVASSTSLFTPSGQNSARTTSASAIPHVLPLASAQTSETSTTMPVPATLIFNFGNNAANNPATVPSVPAAAPVEKPKFPFVFGSNTSATASPAPPLLPSSVPTQPVFKSHFVPLNDNNTKNTNSFGLSQGNAILSNSTLGSNTLGGTNGISATNGLVSNNLPVNQMGGNTLGGNSLSLNMMNSNAMTSNTFGTNNVPSGNGISSPNTLGGTNGMTGIPQTGGNNLQPTNTLSNNSLNPNPPNIFGTPVQKENMWNANSNNNGAPSSNLFGSNTTPNNGLQKPTTFTFGTSSQFNANNSAPAFGNNAPPAQNIFGMANQNNNNQPTLFSNPVQNQPPAPMFGSPQSNSTPAPQMNMFGTPSLGGTPAFGAPSASLPSFETPSMNPTPAAAFTFGAQPQPQAAPFMGFRPQQPQPQQEQTGGMYNFTGSPQVQFNMGTAPTRRIRKAIRRTQR